MKLSACMIVKNEEAVLARALGSIRALVDEIVLIDTGSTDGTLDIAERFGCRIFHSPWQDDFAFHRNESIEKASGDWIMIIDADEELVADNIDPVAFKRRLETTIKTNGLLVTVHDLNRHGQVTSHYQGIRFFRRDCGARYDGIVHNVLMGVGSAGATDLVFRHYGYDRPKETMAAKMARSTRLLQKRIEQNFDDYEARFYLATLAYNLGENREALDYGVECLSVAAAMGVAPQDMKHSFMGGIYFLMAVASLNLTLAGEAIMWARHGLNLMPDDPDLWFAVGLIGHETGETGMMHEGRENYLAAIEQHKEKPYMVEGRFVITIGPDYQKRVALWD